MSKPQRYRIRYKIEVGDFAKPQDVDREDMPRGIGLSPDDFGYADDLFIVSMVGKEPAEQSFLMLSTKSGGHPSRDELLELRSYLDHYLSHHA